MMTWVLTRTSSDGDAGISEEAPDVYLSRFDAYGDQTSESDNCKKYLEKEYPGQDVKLVVANEGDSVTVTRSDKFGTVLETRRWSIWEREL